MEVGTVDEPVAEAEEGEDEVSAEAAPAVEAPAAEPVAALRPSDNVLEAEGTWGDDDDEEEEEPPSSREPPARAESAVVEQETAEEEVTPAVVREEEAPRRAYARREGGFRAAEQDGRRGGGARYVRGRHDRFEEEEDRHAYQPSRRRNGEEVPKEYQKPAWARQGDESNAVVVLKKAKSILNKLTLEKFERLSEEFVGLPFDSVELVAGAIDLIVDKAQRETHFVDIYAELCVKLAATPLAGLGEVEKGKKFRRLLLERCQAEFERDDEALLAEIEAITDVAEREQRCTQIRKIYIGHVYFIGALYRKELLRESIMHHCIQELFGDPDEPDDEKIECLAKLMTTVGKQIDHAALEKKESHKFMKAYFKQLKKLTKSDKLANRIRFLVRDLCDLRDNDWKPRRNIERAKTIAEIHEDVRREEDEKAGKKPSSLRKDAKSDSGRSCSKNANAHTDDGWETVGGAKSSSASALKPNRGAQKPSPEPVSASAFGAFASLSSSGKSDHKKKKKKKDEKSVDKAEKKKPKPASEKPPSADKLGAADPESASPAPPFDENAYKAKAKAAIDEYVAIEQIDEVVSCIEAELDKMAGSPQARYLVVSQTLDVLLNCKERDRPKLTPLLLALVQKNALDELALRLGFLEVLQFLPDFAIDIPNAKEWLGSALKALVEANALQLDFLAAAPPNAIADGGDDCLKVWDDFKSYVGAVAAAN